MKNYILITDTKECKINNSLLDFVSNYLRINTGKKIPFRELSSKQAYEWDCSNTLIKQELKNNIKNFISSKNIDCNFIFTTKERKKKITSS